ncbi:MAG TPA: cytochrome c [Casimicrobium sp.]|nr:cytochrome c [Casimicrobium sp.]
MKAALFILAGFALIGAASAADLAAGAAKAKEVCAACHGADGNSTDVNNPRLAGQHADYLAKALRDYKSGERANPIMKGFATALSKRDIENLSAYFASQKSSLSVKY